jgi:hypothetical protein
MHEIFIDDSGIRVHACDSNILKWDGARREPAFPRCANAITGAYVFLTLCDGSTHTLRDAEAERFLSAHDPKPAPTTSR